MTKTILIPKALSDKKGNLTYLDCGEAGCNVDINKVGPYAAEISTIDDEIFNSSYKIGFIKIDAEGYTYKILKGGINTLQRDRPVLSLAIYHNYEEVFQTYDLVDSLNNYLFEFQLQNNVLNNLGELILFAYPAELF